MAEFIDYECDGEKFTTGIPIGLIEKLQSCYLIMLGKAGIVFKLKENEND